MFFINVVCAMLSSASEASSVPFALINVGKTEMKKARAVFPAMSKVQVQFKELVWL